MRAPKALANLRSLAWPLFGRHWNRNCLGQFRGIHRGSTLKTRVITCRWRYIMWRWRHRNHFNTITSVIAAKQTAEMKFMCVFFSIKYRYIAIAIFYLKIKQQHKLHLFCWLHFSDFHNNRFFIELSQHATELIFYTPVPANKMELFGI